jgi:urease accessory protein
MSVATLRYDLPLHDAPARTPSLVRHQRNAGRLDLSFAKGGNATVLAGLYQQSPSRVLFPRPPAGEPPLAVLVNTSGGMAGGDRASVAVSIGAGAAATVTTQAAEKIYRSLGPDTRVDTRLEVGDAGQLEWLPQETILFDGASVDRHLDVTIAESGRLLACETLVFGRAARGETMRRGKVRESWRIERGGRLAWVDRLGLSGDIAARLDGMGFGGARALATALYAGPDAATLVPAAQQTAAEEGGGSSLVNGVLVARLLGANPARVRDGLARLIALLRGGAFGFASGAPALWAR